MSQALQGSRHIRTFWILRLYCFKTAMITWLNRVVETAESPPTPSWSRTPAKIKFEIRRLKEKPLKIQLKLINKPQESTSENKWLTFLFTYSSSNLIVIAFELEQSFWLWSGWQWAFEKLISCFCSREDMTEHPKCYFYGLQTHQTANYSYQAVLI